MNLYEKWKPEHLPGPLRDAIDELRKARHFEKGEWLECGHDKGAEFGETHDTAPAIVSYWYRLKPGAQVPGALSPWVDGSGNVRAAEAPSGRMLKGQTCRLKGPKSSWRRGATISSGIYDAANPGDTVVLREYVPQDRPDTRVVSADYDGMPFFIHACLLEPAGLTCIDDPETKTQTQGKTMSPIKIETNVTFIDGARVANLTATDRSALLARVENEIKRLEALEFKTAETKDEIEALRANALDLVAAFDADYAARKAAEAKK